MKGKASWRWPSGHQKKGDQDSDDLAGQLAGQSGHRELLAFSFSMSGTLAPRCQEMQADESKVKKMPTGMCRWAKVAKRERA